MENKIELVTALKKLAEMYGLGILTQFVMEERGMDATNQQMINLQMLDALRDQVKLVAMMSDFSHDDHDDDIDE